MGSHNEGISLERHCKMPHLNSEFAIARPEIRVQHSERLALTIGKVN